MKLETKEFRFVKYFEINKTFYEVELTTKLNTTNDWISTSDFLIKCITDMENKEVVCGSDVEKQIVLGLQNWINNLKSITCES